LTAASIDHLVSLIIFVSAIMLFIGMFSQTVQTGVTYQLHNAVSSKCSDLLDNMLLSPGIPPEWGDNSSLVPEGFGLQAVEFTQYQLSPFSLMRLSSSTGTPVTYDFTGKTYSNITIGFGQSLLVPLSEAMNYSTASRLLGINGSYGFSLMLTPIVDVVISEQANPQYLSVDVSGPGFPLANAKIDYCLIEVDGSDDSAPTYGVTYGSTNCDEAGFAQLNLGFDGHSESYALMACAHLSGLVGIGYHENVLYDESYVIPLVNFTDENVIIAHSWDVTHLGDADAAIRYNASFVVFADDFKLRATTFDNETGSSGGLINSMQFYDTLTMDTNSPGILVVTYSKSAYETGVVVMPWGLSSLAFPITFGGDLESVSWAATDIRQVMVNGVAYQAKLAVWSLSGYQVNG
jgi:hypothetical protein